MNRRAFGAAAAALVLLSVPVLSASPGDLEKVLSRMEKAEAEMRTLSFDFVQTADIAVTGEKQKVKGTAYFRKPNQFRVEHQSPQAQTVVSDGEALWLHNPAQNQVFVDSWENWAKSAGFPKGLVPFQMNVGDIRERYDVVFEQRARADGKSGAVLRLRPKDEGPWPYHFRLWIDEATGLPFRTELETRGVKAATQVSRLKLNPELKDTLFILAVPEGAEVLGSALPPR
jgi:outer membrane lipoprotein carrier protein